MSRPLLVKDLMTGAVISLALGDSLADAERTMREAKVRHLPVIDATGRLVGLVTKRTVLAAWVGHGDPTRERHEDVARDVPIEMIMERDVVTIGPEARAADAARILEERRFGALPVVDAGGRLLGLLTESDFVQFARIYLERAGG